MRSRVKMKLTGRTQDGWYPFFAWYPKRIYQPIKDAVDPMDRAWITVWLETVEYKSRDNDGNSPWQWRLKGPK